MANWTLPAELDQPLPRMVKRRRVFVFVIASQAFSLVLFFVVLGAVMGPAIYKNYVLRERGVGAQATVTRLYTSSGSKGSTNYNVVYTYQSAANTVHTATDGTNAAWFNELHVGDNVPIAYDPVYPPRSELNFNNLAFTRDNTLLTALPGIAIVFPLFTAGVFVFSYRRQKRLLQWGKVAAATIVSDTEYNAGKAGRKAAVTYTFTDEQGRTVQGKRTGLPTKNSRKENMYQEMFGDPTVLYDPDDSSKNMLYPLAWVDCQPKPEPSVFSKPQGIFS